MGLTPKQMYEEAKRNGLPTPLDDTPTYPSYFNSLLTMFWDIFQYKTEYDSYMPLSLFESYQNLFETKIHPYHISLIIQLDRAYTAERTTIMQDARK